MPTRHTLTGTVVAPWDPGYDQSRLDYNLRFTNFYPDYINYCHTIEDVERAVRWARHHRIPFRIRSGGHSYEAYSLINHGLIIDVSRLNRILVDAETHTARIGAGAQLLDVYETLWERGKVTIPGGSCPTVGIAGLTLGGGFGLVSRQFGLTIDALLAVTLVDARGCRLTVSARSHPDLFWALRGAGANNFGVVTEFLFRTYPVDDVAIFFLQWTWDTILSIIPAFQHWSDPTTLDPRLTPILTLPSKRQGHVSVVGAFLGPQEKLETLLAPLLDLPGRTAYTVHTMSYIEAVRHFAGLGTEPARWIAHGVPDHDTFKHTSAYAYHLFPKDALTVIQDALADTPGPACLVQMGGFGGAIQRVAPEATAFYHRRARSDMQYQAYWTDPAVAPAHMRWVEHFRRAMRPYTEGAYVNYCDSHIRDWPRAYWGPNLGRLIALKRQWDPDNLFRFPQGLNELV